MVESGGFYPGRTISIPIKRLMRKGNRKIQIEQIVDKHQTKHKINRNDCEENNPFALAPGDVVFKRLEGKVIPKFKADHATGPYIILGRKSIKGITTECYLLNCVTNRLVRTETRKLFPVYMIDYLSTLSPTSRRIHFDRLPTLNKKVTEKLLLRKEDTWVCDNLARTLTGEKARVSKYCLRLASKLTGILPESLEDHETREKVLWLDAKRWIEVGLGDLMVDSKKDLEVREKHVSLRQRLCGHVSVSFVLRVPN